MVRDLHDDRDRHHVGVLRRRTVTVDRHDTTEEIPTRQAHRIGDRGALGAVICTPPHLISRVGILMLGSRTLFIPGLLLLTFGATVHAGATGAVKAIKMSSKLVAGDSTPSDSTPSRSD